MTPPVLMCNCFTDMEDSATLGSDTSAISGLRGAVHMYCLFVASAGRVALPLGNQSDKPTFEKLAVYPCGYTWFASIRGFAPEAGRGRAAAFEPGTTLERYQLPCSAENYWRCWNQFPDICFSSLPGTLQGRGYFPVSRYV